MKKLIVARHGSYDSIDLCLNGRGREQITELGARIKDLVGSDSRVVLASTADRGRQSGEIIADILTVSLEEHHILWSDADHPHNLESVLALVRGYVGVDVVVVVTHLEYAEEFPGYFAEYELGMPNIEKYLEKGEAVMIDCEAKKMVKV